MLHKINERIFSIDPYFSYTAPYFLCVVFVYLLEKTQVYRSYILFKILIWIYFCI